MRNDELVSIITKTHPRVDPTASSGSNNEIEEPQIKQTNRRSVSRHRFEIEGEAFIVTLQDEEEPRNIKKALNCPTKEKWKKVMKEEIESMKQIRCKN